MEAFDLCRFCTFLNSDQLSGWAKFKYLQNLHKSNVLLELVSKNKQKICRVIPISGVIDWRCKQSGTTLMHSGKFSPILPKLVWTYPNREETLNFNVTITFETDIDKKSSPINWNLYQTWLLHKCLGCFWLFGLFLFTSYFFSQTWHFHKYFGCLVHFCVYWILLR